ncbi:MAG: hypothetical protein IJ001_10380 [Oscillospiraceae bacterium]|nr:hypothetical protein [Oscillospiraceae bacterium]
MAKKMVINCATCDARKVSKETLAAYESIMINAANVLVSPETKEMLNQHGVLMNCASVLELDADVEVSTSNGSTQINSSDVVTGRCHLTVNGSLQIGPGTEKILEQYVGIFVNGSVTCPESISAYLGKIKVNGSINTYPDNAIILKRSAVIDRLFALRAKNSLYWSAKRMIMVDPQLDAAVLAKKGATFSTKQVIIAESKVESMIELIDEKAEIVIVPDGTAVVMDDVELNEMTLKKYGTKLYIIGDLKAKEDAADILPQIEYLHIRGDAFVTEELKQQLMAAISEISGDVKALKRPKGRHLEDKISLRLSKWLVEQEPDGISVSDCMQVTLDEDIPNDLILNKLSFSDCMKIKCTPEQEAAVAAVSEDVMTIGKDTGEDGMGIGTMIKDALGIGKDLLTTKIINAAEYVL